MSSYNWSSGGGPSKIPGHVLAAEFTPTMRDRQARGKHPYERDNYHPTPLTEEEQAQTAKLGSASVGNSAQPVETYEEIQSRNFAMSVLDNPEKLLMYAQSEDDSVAGQRLRFTRMLAGKPLERSYRNPILRERETEYSHPAMPWYTRYHQPTDFSSNTSSTTSSSEDSSDSPMSPA